MPIGATSSTLSTATVTLSEATTAPSTLISAPAASSSTARTMYGLSSRLASRAPGPSPVTVSPATFVSHFEDHVTLPGPAEIASATEPSCGPPKRTSNGRKLPPSSTLSSKRIAAMAGSVETGVVVTRLIVPRKPPLSGLGVEPSASATSKPLISAGTTSRTVSVATSPSPTTVSALTATTRNETASTLSATNWAPSAA